MILDNPPDLFLFLGLGLWIVFPFVMGKVWLASWKEKPTPGWVLLACPLLVQAALAIFYNNDLALVTAYQADGGATLPYGRLWFLLNPLYGTTHAYLWFVFCWNAAFAWVMYKLAWHGRLKFTWVYWCEVLNIVLILVHNPQSTVPMTLVYLAPALGPLALGLAAAIKLPLGWSPIFANRHWQCAFGSDAPPGAPYWECLHFSPSYFLHSMDAWYNFTMYAILGAWTVWSLKVWKNERSPRKLAFDFLNATRSAGLAIKFMQATGLYERRVVRLVKALSGRTAVDVGANDGFYTRLLGERFQQVLPIDPNPRYGWHPRMALSDRNGEAWLYFNKNSPRAGSLLESFRYRDDDYRGRDKILTPVRRLDNCKRPIDFVKIDVEGAEFEVLRGMEGANVKQVLVELHDESRDLELIALLGLQGFTVAKIDRNHFLGTKHF